MSSAVAHRFTHVPPHVFFAVSAIFHYLGPSFAILLFSKVGVLGVALMRIGSAAIIFAPITRPWCLWSREDPRGRRLLLFMGACLALMNSCFYLALSRLPISLVAAMEFVGTIGLAVWGLRTVRNLAALALSIAGVLLLIELRWSSDALGLLFAALNSLFFVAYVVLGHKFAEGGAGGGIERLGAAMLIAGLLMLPVGLPQALVAAGSPMLIAAGVGVGICSSVVPYVCDQLAMARLPRASFALLLALLPASATLVGAIVLRQFPSARDIVGIFLVMCAVAVHRPAPTEDNAGSEKLPAERQVREPACNM